MRLISGCGWIRPGRCCVVEGGFEVFLREHLLLLVGAIAFGWGILLVWSSATFLWGGVGLGHHRIAVWGLLHWTGWVG